MAAGKQYKRFAGHSVNNAGYHNENWNKFFDGNSLHDVAYDSLAEAITYIGTSNSKTLYITTQHRITSNTTIPSNISLVVLKGGSFAIDSGVTLTINGPFDAGRFRVFSGSGSVAFGAHALVLPEWFGAVADGATDDGAYINKAIDSLTTNGGTVLFACGKTYAVHAGNNRIRIRSNVTLDLGGCTIQRIGTNYSNNLIENYTYAPGTGYDSNVTLRNGTIKGNGTSDTSTQSHTVPAANVFWFGVNKFRIEKIKSDTANGDCLGWRLANDGWVDSVVGGSFGRNLISPTSGMRNRITNCNFDFAGLSGATPGAYIDVENDAADETSDTYWENVAAKGAVFVDFWTASGGDFAHHARFVGCKFTGDSPRTFSIQSTNPTVARGFVIGDTCRVAVAINTAAAVKISQVSGVICNAYLANDSGSQGTSKAIWIGGNGSARNAASGGRFTLTGIDGMGSFATKTLTITNTVSAGSETIAWTSTAVTIAVQAGVSTVAQVLAKVGTGSETGTPWATIALHTAGTVAALASTAMASLTAYSDGGTENVEFNGRVAVDEFSTGLYAVDVPVKNSRFTGMFIGDVQLREGSSGNVFNGCKVGVLTIIDSGSNEFKDTNITGAASITTNTSAVTTAASNDFTGCTLADLTLSGAATINNRFRTDTRITGTKTFASSATWLGNIFEKEEGSLTITVTGSTSGSATLSASWGRYNVLGDVLHYALSLTISASTGAGDQRINLGLPNSIVAVDGVTPSRWPVAFHGNGFAFTGSQVIGFISGGNGFITLSGLDNAGTLTSVPASTAAGTIYLEGFFRVR